MSPAAWQGVPGRRLRGLALHLFGRPIAERFLFPALADLQHEVRSVASASRARRLPVQARAYLAFWRAAGACWLLVGEPGAARTTIAVAGTMLVAVVFLSLLESAPLLFRFDGASLYRVGPKACLELLALLQPQALAVTLPVGALFAGLLAYRRSGRQPAALVARPVLAMSVAAGLLALLMTLWAVPGANQAFRERVYTRPFAAARAVPAKGAAEMTVAELLDARNRSAGDPRAQATYDFFRHQKAALPAAALVFALVAISLGRERVSRWPALRSALLTTLLTAAYCLLFWGARSLALGEAIPPWAGAWASNMVFTLAACLAASWRLRRLTSQPPLRNR